MDLALKALSDITVYSKYARYLPEKKRRETWEECVTRCKEMHLRKYPEHTALIEGAFKYVYDKKVLPSMRALQFSGAPIEKKPSRINNCAYVPISEWEAFHEIMYLLLGGTGVGFSVQFHHIAKLPEVKELGTRKRTHVVADSIEGWADAVKVLFRSYFFGLSRPVFDYSLIRPEGSPIKTGGGKAPGPEPLRECLFKIERVLKEKAPGDRLRPLEVHDMVCHIAAAVLSGGVRRSATISLFSVDDEEMTTCKYGDWYLDNVQRSYANNSAVLIRSKATERKFNQLWKRVRASGSGEPGIFHSNSKDAGSNPCMSLETHLLTPKGIRKLRDIGVGDEVWSGDEWTTVVRKWKTGNKLVQRFTTNAGSFLGTGNHEVFFKGEKTPVEDADGIDICLGPEAPDGLDLNPQDIMDGIVLGDGVVHKASNNLVGIHIGNNDESYHSSEVRHLIKKHRPGVSPTFWGIETTITHDELPHTCNREVPDRFFYGTAAKKLAFLKGIFSANGCVTSNRVQYKGASKRLVAQIQEMLSSLGLRSSLVVNHPTAIVHSNGTYTSRKSYNLIIYNHSEMFLRQIGFIQPYKMLKHAKDDKELYAHSRIVSVKNVGYEDVYDITVAASAHRFWCGGHLVSNCVEIGLKPHQFCNLSSVNVSDVETQEELENRCAAAATIGTLQAGYTNFNYLRDIWRATTEEEALIGVSMTGIASGAIQDLDLTRAAEVVTRTNTRVAEAIGISSAARTTCVKPEGTASCVLGTSSGIHSWHSKYYIRRLMFLKSEQVYKYLKRALPNLIEDSTLEPETKAYLTLPIKAPEGSVLRTSESALELLERSKHVYDNWVKKGHREGVNTNNVSITVSVKEEEWDTVGEWMWKNRNSYNGIAVLPYDGHTYAHTPFEEITEEKYLELLKHVRNIDLTKVLEEEDLTEHGQEIACSGGKCEL